MGRRIWAALLCGLLLCAPALAIGPVSGEQMRGMDVSVYQGNVDFAAAKADGIETVYIRAGYGETGVDAYYRQHYEGASAAGLKVGFYHYMDAVTEEGARRQAAHFAALIRDLPADCRPVMDFETFGGMDRGCGPCLSGGGGGDPRPAAHGVLRRLCRRIPHGR